MTKKKRKHLSGEITNEEHSRECTGRRHREQSQQHVQRCYYSIPYHIYSSKRHRRPLRTILFGGLGLRVGVLGLVRVWVRVRVSIRISVGVALVRS